MDMAPPFTPKVFALCLVIMSYGNLLQFFRKLRLGQTVSRSAWGYLRLGDHPETASLKEKKGVEYYSQVVGRGMRPGHRRIRGHGGRNSPCGSSQREAHRG